MVKDHNGKKFTSVKKMCDFYGIPVSVYTERIHRSRWNKKKALETPCSSPHQVKDHNGKIFPTKTKMCEAYDISVSCYRYRAKAGWPLKKILTTPSMASHKDLQADKDQKENDKYDKVIEVVEKLSNKVDNMEKQLRNGCTSKNNILDQQIGKFEVNSDGVKFIVDMNDISYRDIVENQPKYKELIGENLVERLVAKVPEEDIPELTKPGPIPIPVRDHKGSLFSSIKDMCKAYGIKERLYRSRVWDGWPISYALERKCGDSKFYDHLGREYKYLSVMCNHYNINKYEFADRINEGWTLEDALTLPTEHQLGID